MAQSRCKIAYISERAAHLAYTIFATDSKTNERLQKQWTTLKQGHRDGGKPTYSKDIEPGDVGIWASCNKGKEGKCVAELKDLFQEVRCKKNNYSGWLANATQYAERMYAIEDGISNAAKNASDDDVGAEIERELQGLKKPQTELLFSSIKLDTPCRQFCNVCC